MSQITINPLLTTNAAGTFSTTSEGVIQGTAWNDPAVRNELAGGVLSNAETLPMWGGVAIFENIPGLTNGPSPSLGGVVGRATSITGATAIMGFSVFDQAHAMINTPQSPVPLAPGGASVNFYRLGTNARIAVAIDPALVDQDGDPITSQVSWDFGLQRLAPYVAAYPANVITAATWASTAGGQATLTTTSAHGVGVGDDFTITGIIPAAYNGTFTALAGTTGSTLVYALPLASTPGAGTAFGTLVAGGGALPVRILRIFANNCMTINFDPSTGFATWNRNGSAAMILI